MKIGLPILLSCWLFPVLGIAQHQAADLLRHYRQILPFEKLYLHTDQSVYEPGDNIWFRAYLTDDYNRPSGAASSRVQVQLLDPQGQVVHTSNINTQSTDLTNYIPINANTAGGVYTLRASTQWLFNFGPDAFYEKKILVQKTILPRLRLKLELDRSKYQPSDRVIAQLEALSNDNQALKNIDLKATPILGSTSLEAISAQTDQEGKATIVFQLPAQLPNVDGLLQVKLLYEGQSESIARSIPIQLEQVKMGIFPEGGDLVAGFLQKIAFKMMDTLGNPIDGRGTLFNDQHQTLLSFESYHKGMGHFSFRPGLGERYYLKIDGQKDSFLLPDPRQDELALRVGLADRDSLPLKIWKRTPGQAQLVLRSKDSIVWQQKLFFQAGETSLKLPIAKLPIGIAQVLVLDESERPYAERLVFLSRHRQAQLRISAAKKEYLPLDEVEINIEASDEMGKPLDGIFSLAVVNDLHWTMADDKQDNILSRLLLSAELKGKIDEPAFYFKPNEPKVPEALDLVMLTHGWRKFTWKEILTIEPQNSASLVLFNNIVEIKGHLMLGHKGIHFPKSKVWIKGRNEQIAPDSLGHFKFILPESTLSNYLTLVAKSKGYRAEQVVFQFPKPTINWPKGPEKTFKALIINEISEPKITVDAKELPILDQPFNPLSELSGELNEVVVTGYSVALLRSVTGSVVSYSNQDLKAGIGDNLFIGGNRSIYRGNNLHIELEKEPLELPHEYVKKEVYNRLFANLPKTDAFTETQRRNTIHWAPFVDIKNGKGKLKFHQTDKTGTFRIVLEGVAQQAVVVHGELTYSVQKPVEFAVQVPNLVLSGDTLILDTKIKNRTHGTVTGKLHIPFLSDAFQLLDKNQEQQIITILPDTFATIKIPLLVKRIKTQTSIALQWLSGNKVENWKQPIEVQVHGFQHEVAQSSQQAHVIFQIPLSSFIPGSLIANFNAYTMIYQELVEGLASIIREPHGCFEQVSSSNYPSIMALKLLNETGGVDFAFQKKAIEHLHKGYQLLTGYEVNGGGFSIFGHAPASERLTAYGLLQFWDMRSVYPDVDMKMFEKNLNWLVHQKKLNHGYYAPDVLSHLFTLYALSEFRPELLQQDLVEFEQTHKHVLAEDPYLLSMLLCANANLKALESTQRLQQQLKQLLQVQKPGTFKVTNTFGLSYGKNVQTETAAWATLALCKAGQAPAPEVQALLEFLRSSRDYGGGFGSTQATVIALKALQAFHQQTGNSAEPGKIRVRVNQTWLDTLNYTPKQLQKLQVEFGQWLKPGQNEIEVIQESAEQAIPFLLQANWSSSDIPISKQKKALTLQTHYSNTQVDQGDFVRLTVKVKNELERSVNAPMAVIGIPAGLSLQSWQLMDMAKQRVFDHFELKDNYLIVYFESLPTGVERDFQLDLKAEQAGYYQSPSSVAYPYYDAEQKTWASASSIHIRPSSN